MGRVLGDQAGALRDHGRALCPGPTRNVACSLNRPGRFKGAEPCSPAAVYGLAGLSTDVVLGSGWGGGGALTILGIVGRPLSTTPGPAAPA